MVRLSSIIKQGPKSRKQQLKKKLKLFERGHSFRENFLNNRNALDKHLIAMEISDQKIKIWLLRSQINSHTGEVENYVSELQNKQKDLEQRTIELVQMYLKSALVSNEQFNEDVKEFIKSSNLDPFEFDEFWDVVIKHFIEVYLKGLPEFILTSSILTDFWQERLNEKSKSK